jgi:hypothetical protein
VVEHLGRRRRRDPQELESHGALVASGLIAGESLTGVLLAGLVLAWDRFSSVTKLAFGVDQLAWVAGPAGAWTSLLALGAIVWLLVALPLRRARAAP